MKQSQGIGAEQPDERTDSDHNGVPDKSERDFAEAGQVQAQPADAKTAHKSGDKREDKPKDKSTPSL